MKLYWAALAFATFPFRAVADDQGIFYAAAGGGGKGAVFSLGAGTKVDAIEVSSINLGTVGVASSAKFTGISLVQNATPVNGFSFLFRVGIGRATTTFANGAKANRSGLGNGIFFGIGEQYQLNSHLAIRAEVNRISYAASTDGSTSGARYPITLSGLLIF